MQKFNQCSKQQQEHLVSFKCLPAMLIHSEGAWQVGKYAVHLFSHRQATSLQLTLLCLPF